MAISGKEEYRELTDNGLAESAGLISRREYNLSIVRSRQTAELLIKSYAAEKGIAYTTLADTIESLYAQGIISRNSRDAFHNIRIYGNKAVHDGDNDPENAQKAYYLLKSEVSTFLSRKSVSVDRTPIRVQPGGGSKQLNELEVEISHDPDDTAGRKKLNESRQDVVGQSASGQYAYADTEENVAGNKRRRISRDGGERRDGRDSDRRRDIGGNRSGDRRRADHGERGRDRNRDLRGERRQQQGRRGGSAGGRRDNRAPRKEAARSSISIYDLLRILLPIAVIVLLIVIIRSFMAARQPEETTVETTTVIETTVQMPETETETEPETTEPETTAAPVEYRVKSDGVNVRYADNQNRIYTQLSKGTAIGTVTEIEGSDFVSFTLDGVNVVVRKDLIEPIQ